VGRADTSTAVEDRHEEDERMTTPTPMKRFVEHPRNVSRNGHETFCTVCFDRETRPR
jgi:hypothetical protein